MVNVLLRTAWEVVQLGRVRNGLAIGLTPELAEMIMLARLVLDLLLEQRVEHDGRNTGILQGLHLVEIT